MALYDVTARLNIDSLIYLDENDFESEEEIKRSDIRVCFGISILRLD